MSTTRLRLPRAQRERRILDAAVGEFDRFGFREASMERIAERAGITKALDLSVLRLQGGRVQRMR